MRAASLLLMLMLACGDSGTPADTSTSTTTSSTSSSTESPIDCSAVNSCIQHPDVCPAPCACDDSAPADAICGTVAGAGEFLLRCVDGVGLAGVCPYGCRAGLPEEQAYCLSPQEECPNVACDSAPAGCGDCDCNNSGGSFCAGPLLVNTACDITFCGFGCGLASTGPEAVACCSDKLCP